MGNEHDLKCQPEPFADILNGAKTAEYRRDDRDFRVGDVLILREWDPNVRREVGHGAYSGRVLRKTVTHISRGPDWEIPTGFVVLSLGRGAEYEMGVDHG